MVACCATIPAWRQGQTGSACLTDKGTTVSLQDATSLHPIFWALRQSMLPTCEGADGERDLAKASKVRHSLQTRCSGATPILQVVASVLQAAARGTVVPASAPASRFLLLPVVPSHFPPSPPIFPTSSSSVVTVSAAPALFSSDFSLWPWMWSL